MLPQLPSGAGRLVALLLGASTLIQAQNDVATDLRTCLTAAGVRSIAQSDGNDVSWANATQLFNLRFHPTPAQIAYPTTREQISASLSCAHASSVKVTALGGAHSFAAWGFGRPGGLVVSMAAFTELSYDEQTQELTFGGGTHVGPAAKYLWDGWGRHFPHVRGSSVGLVGSSFGGGFGSTSRWLGTPMDNIMAAEFMLWNGTVVTASPGSDLLWATKGAAPSYGVVLSMTTKTFKPTFDTAVNYTISLDFTRLDVDTAARALLAVQEFGLDPQTPHQLAMRWMATLGGYFYGDPAAFDGVIAPLITALRSVTGDETIAVAKTELPFWDMEVQVVGPGMNLPGGGSVTDCCGFGFYIQALTTTVDHLFTFELARGLASFFIPTAATSRRRQAQDILTWGYLDLWGGSSLAINDADTAYIHGRNAWILRVDAISQGPLDSGTFFDNGGLAAVKAGFRPFEQALTASGVPLRGFVNYPDTELTEEEWSSRLYGENFGRLKALKMQYDPVGMFVSHAQSIPLSRKCGQPVEDVQKSG